MNERTPVNRSEYEAVPSLKLKDKSTEDLYNSVLEIAVDWSPEWQEKLAFAYGLALRAHAYDRHKDRPYSEHLLRVASRLATYLEVKDPTVIIAAILHDIVEDHGLELINGSLIGNERRPLNGREDLDRLSLAAQKEVALRHVGVMFGPEVGEIVEAVTNAPNSEEPLNYEDKIQAYVDKIALAIRSPKAWLVKFSDWCDNALSVNYDLVGQGDKHDHFVYKYGQVLPILKARFEEDDIQAMLSESAKQYVRQQFVLGEQRLQPGLVTAQTTF